MAHLGVLKALEQHGIYIDMLSGTSSGAMVGTIYSVASIPSTLVNASRPNFSHRGSFPQRASRFSGFHFFPADARGS